MRGCRFIALSLTPTLISVALQSPYHRSPSCSLHLSGSRHKAVTAQGFSQSLRQVIDFVHCGVEYHASFTKQSLSSILEKSLAVTTTWNVLIVMPPE